MNNFIDFLKSRWGLSALSAALLLIAFSAWRGARRTGGPPAVPLSTNASTMSERTRSAGSIPAPPPPPRAPATNAPKAPEIFIFDTVLPPDTNSIPAVYAPAGCSLKCVLVNTVESIRIETPVIGLVTEDLWFNGKLVVPKGTKVLGKARVDRVRDRLDASGNWTLVFPNGEELIVPGIALHSDVSPDGHYGPDDGSAGLKGLVIRSATWEELKMFAATFLASMSRGLQQTESTIYGSQVSRTLQNGALAGSAAVIDEYARSIAETIKKDGIYVRVSGGSSFSLFLPIQLNRSAARVGATQLSNKAGI